jgi:hypothetical protein
LHILPPLYVTLVAIIALNATGRIPAPFEVAGTLAAAFHPANY